MKKHAVESICALVREGIICNLRTAAHSGTPVCLSAFLGVNNQFIDTEIADSSVRAVEGVGLRPLACWDRGFESRLGHGCLSLVSVFVSSGRGLIDGLMQRTPRECGVSECDREASSTRKPWLH
jgi:hypothetical protein